MLWICMLADMRTKGYRVMRPQRYHCRSMWFTAILTWNTNDWTVPKYADACVQSCKLGGTVEKYATCRVQCLSFKKFWLSVIFTNVAASTLVTQRKARCPRAPMASNDSACATRFILARQTFKGLYRRGLYSQVKKSIKQWKDVQKNSQRIFGESGSFRNFARRKHPNNRISGL